MALADLEGHCFFRNNSSLYLIDVEHLKISLDSCFQQKSSITSLCVCCVCVCVVELARDL